MITSGTGVDVAVGVLVSVGVGVVVSVGVGVNVIVGVGVGVSSSVGVSVGVGVGVGVADSELDVPELSLDDVLDFVVDSSLYVELLTPAQPGVGVYTHSQIKHGPSVPVTKAE